MQIIQTILNLNLKMIYWLILILIKFIMDHWFYKIGKIV
jgi:hypothetical protein